MQEQECARQLCDKNVLVNNRPEECPTSRNTEEQSQSESEDINPFPFSFRPQLIHLHKDHELFEDGDVQRHMYLQDLYVSEANEKPALSVSVFACHITGCSAVFSTIEEYEHHYNSLHRHVCCSCRRSLPSAWLLDIHIQEWHDTLFSILAQSQDMYQCLVEGCGQKFSTSNHRKDHLIRIHKYPPDFRFDKSKKKKGGKDIKIQKQKDAAMEGVDDVCKSEGVCEVMCDEMANQLEQGESMEMHVSEEEAAPVTKSASGGEHSELGAAHSPEPLQARYSYRVPKSVCFGKGSIRGFRGRQGRRK